MRLDSEFISNLVRFILHFVNKCRKLQCAEMAQWIHDYHRPSQLQRQQKMF